MKRLFLSILLSCAALAACTQEKITALNGADVPKASEYVAVVDVNQTTNIASFSITAADGTSPKGVYPVWEVKIGKKTLRGTGNNFKTSKIIFKGDYEYSLRIANRNGLSDGSITGTFTVENLGYDFSDIGSSLYGDGTKEWRIYSAVAEHIGCGDGPGNPTGWWKAGPEEKATNSIYDDRITFTKGENSATGTYKYSAGEDGLTFCNKGVTVLGPGDTENDYDVAAVDSPNAKVEVTYDLGIVEDGEIPTITLPAGTLIPYMADNAQVNNATTYTITELKEKFMTWRIDLPGISWQLKFINGDDPAPEETPQPNWVDVNSNENLWHTAKIERLETYYADANWAPYSTTPTITELEDGKSWTINYPLATVSMWQNQFTVVTDIPATMDQKFDVKVTVVSNKGGFNAVAKLVQPNESETVKHDSNFICSIENFPIEKGENVLWASNCSLKENDAPTLQFVFDFGGNPEETEITIKDIIIQLHETEPEWVAVDSPDNLWWNSTLGATGYYYADAGWAPYPTAPEITDNGDKTWTINYPLATVSRWQNQFNVQSDLSATMDQLFDVKLTIVSNKSGFSAVAKLVQPDESETVKHDANFICHIEVPIEKGENILKATKCSLKENDAPSLQFVFDFGGNPEDTKITIKDIIVQYHK